MTKIINKEFLNLLRMQAKKAKSAINDDII